MPFSVTSDRQSELPTQVPGASRLVQTQLHELAPNVDLAAAEYFNTGNYLYRKGKRRQALAFFTRAIGLTREVPQYWWNRSLCNFQLNDYIGALADAEAAIVAEPFAWQGHVRFALALFYLSRYDRAEAALRAALKWNPSCPQLLVVLAALLYTLERYDECISTTRRLLSLSVEYPLTNKAFYLLVEANLHVLPPEVTSTRRYLSSDGAMPIEVELSEYGSEFGDEHQPTIQEETDRHIERLLQQGQNALQTKGDVSTAVECWTNGILVAGLIGNHAKEGELYSRLGSAYRLVGQLDHAIQAHQRALDLSVNEQARSYSGLGNAYFSQGNYKLALEFHLKHLHVEIEKGSATGQGTAYNNIACVQFVLGRFVAAIDFYQQYLRVCRDSDDWVGVGTALNNLTNCHLHIRRLDEARNLIGEALENHPNVYSATISADPRSKNKRTLYLSHCRQTYKLCTELYLRVYVSDAALEWCERGKLRSFLDPLNAVLSSDEMLTDPEADDLRDFASRTGATIVSYSFVSRNRLCAWTVNPTRREIGYKLVQWPADLRFDLLGLVRAGLQESSELAALRTVNMPKLSRSALQRESLRTHTLLARLYDILIRPSRSQFPPAGPGQRIIFLPHETLYEIPFAALYCDEHQRFLVEDYGISVSLCAAVLLRNDRIRRSLTPEAHSAVVAYDETLEDAETEAYGVASFFNVTPMNGSIQTVHAIQDRMRRAHMVHLIVRKGMLRSNEATGGVPVVLDARYACLPAFYPSCRPTSQPKPCSGARCSSFLVFASHPETVATRVL
eukprot:TRINITY_DN5335_c0_g1_i3.p1 TRINITY_DN5335_c0_g1~~TRINITY_DN5335_c0_g1_i3.p1  ORF type:complete len:790 (-),score=86.88 TRINITY_DN5335_c0_g1_i3:354-2723(-)